MTMSSLSFNSWIAPFSAGVRLLWVGMFVLAIVWTSILTKSIKDSKVVFLLGFGFHELFFLYLGRGSHYHLPNRTTHLQESLSLWPRNTLYGFLQVLDLLMTNWQIYLCLENLCFRLVVFPEVTDDYDGIFLSGLIPFLNNFLPCFFRNFRLWIL